MEKYKIVKNPNKQLFYLIAFGAIIFSGRLGMAARIKQELERMTKDEH